jgi:lipoyl(octanoyl) transferase
VVNARNALIVGLPSPAGSAPAEWRVSDSPVSYEAAVAAMDARATAIAAGTAPELVWLLEHPPLYTAGTSANAGDVLDARFPVHESGRGGQLTYHGPGQRVAYVMLDLKRRTPDVRRFVASLEEWIIRTLASFDVVGERRDDNVAPDLSHFSGIVPCGVNETRYGVTSLADLKVGASMTDLDAVLRCEFDRLFGPMAGQTVGSTEKPPLRSARSTSVPSR